MHNAYVDPAYGFGIAAPPKVASMSVLKFFFQFREDREPRPGELQSYTRRWGLSHPVGWAFSQRIPMIAIHRDPLERLRSAYAHRVLVEKEAPARGFRDFCERLGYFRGIPAIAWHTDAQCAWLGNEPAKYLFILPLERLSELPGLVELITSQPAPEVPCIHPSTCKPEWEDGLREALGPWVGEDYAAGWDGRLTRLP
jgi:hypothetical protein